MPLRNKEILLAQLQDNSLEILQVPSVSRRLGERANQLADAVNRTTSVSPNHDGFIDFEKDDPDMIPLVLRDIGERAVLHAADSGMNQRQIASLVTTLGIEAAQVAASKLRNFFDDNQAHRELPTFESDSDLAVTGSNHWTPQENVLAQGRPYVSMNTSAVINSRLSPLVFLHELTHVLRKESEPLFFVDQLERQKVAHELEGYYVAAQIILGYKDADRQRELLEHTSIFELDRARKIESVRLAHQSSENPFDPNNRVVKALVDHDLGVTELIGKLARAQKR